MLTSEHVNAFTACPFFSDLAGMPLWRLIDVAEVRHFRQGQVIFEQGDPGVSIFVIVAGQLEVLKRVRRRFLRLALLEAPEAFGEIAVVDGGPRTATVAAVTDCVLLELSREAVTTAWDDYPEGMRSALHALAGIARRSAKWEEIVLMDARARIAHLLAALADGAGHVPFSQAELAEMLAIHRSQIAKHIADFRRLGYLARTPGRLTVVNHRGLAREYS
ncbi:MAG: Crp/Fnr family transcriptional regulator [Alphaproteobacteria bacterium]